MSEYVIGNVIGFERHCDLSIGEATGVVGASLGTGGDYRITAGVGGKRERVAGVIGDLYLDVVGNNDGAVSKTKIATCLTVAAGKHDS